MTNRQTYQQTDKIATPTDKPTQEVDGAHYL